MIAPIILALDDAERNGFDLAAEERFEVARAAAAQARAMFEAAASK